VARIASKMPKLYILKGGVKMAGYDGLSMSNNAVEAYELGLKPWSRWMKKDLVKDIDETLKEYHIELKVQYDVLIKLPTEALRRAVLDTRDYHHTSYYYNETPFYFVSIIKLANLTNDGLNAVELKYRNEQVAKTKAERWRCLHRTYVRVNYQKRVKMVESEGTIKGDWFYADDDGKKYSVKVQSFRRLERLDV